MSIVGKGDCKSKMESTFFFQAEDGIRDLVRSRGLGDVYKRQVMLFTCSTYESHGIQPYPVYAMRLPSPQTARCGSCLLYTSDAADERSSVDLGGRRIIKKKNQDHLGDRHHLFEE